MGKFAEQEKKLREEILKAEGKEEAVDVEPAKADERPYRSVHYVAVNAGETVNEDGLIAYLTDRGFVRVAPGKIPVPVHSPTYRAFKNGKIRYLMIPFETYLGNNDDKKLVIEECMRFIYRTAETQSGKPKFMLSHNIGKTKNGDMLFVVGHLEDLNDLVHENLWNPETLYAKENPNKYLYPTPWMMYHGKSNGAGGVRPGKDVFRTLIVEAHPDENGHRRRDGEALISAVIKYTGYVSEEERAKGAKPKQRKLDGGFQARIFSDTYDFSAKLKAERDLKEFEYECHKIGVDPKSIDLILFTDCIKGNRGGLKHGDRIDLPCTEFGVVGVITNPDHGKSSISAQAYAFPAKVSKAMLEETGWLEMPDGSRIRPMQLLAKAHAGDAAAWKYILTKSDHDGGFEDTSSLFIKFLLFSIADPSQPSGRRIPKFKSVMSSVAVRCNSFFIDKVLKHRLSNLSLYIANSDKCAEAEKAAADRGEHCWYIQLPKNYKVLREIFDISDDVEDLTPDVLKEIADKWEADQANSINSGRAPYVCIGNMQTFKILRNQDGTLDLRGSSNSAGISPAAMKLMNGDVDGDKHQMYVSRKGVKFPYIASVVPPASKKRPIKCMDQSRFLVHLVNVANTVVDAAYDTAMADLAARKVFTHNLFVGHETKPEASLKIGRLREDQIGALKVQKSEATKVAEAIDKHIEREFAYGGKLPAHKDFYPEFLAVLRKAGKPIRYKSEIGIWLERLELFKKINPRHEDPMEYIWKDAKGLKWEILEKDSELIKVRFQKLWDALSPAIKSSEGLDAPKRFHFKLEHVEKVARKLILKYDTQSKRAIRMKSGDREQGIAPNPHAGQRMFTVMKRGMRRWLNMHAYMYMVGGGKVQAFIQEQMPVFAANQQLLRIFTWLLGAQHQRFLNCVAIRVASLGFGSATGKWSKPGSAFWYLPEEVQVAAARNFDPSNPYLQDAEVMLAATRVRKLGKVKLDEDIEAGNNAIV